MEKTKTRNLSLSVIIMKKIFTIFLLCFIFFSCDSNRHFEENFDFENKTWNIEVLPEFEFEITDIERPYNLYYNIRNTVDFPYSRIFITWYLQDEDGKPIQEKLQFNYLFDEKTGKPFGRSSIGDVYSHRFEILSNYQFTKPGLYRLKLEQFMRVNELKGILSTGIRVEESPLNSLTNN